MAGAQKVPLSEKSLSALEKHTTDALSRDMLVENSATVSIEKPEGAVKKLKVIIAAALRLSNETGFQAKSLQDLSRKAGESMGGLYAYFDGKTTLLHMVSSTVTKPVRGVLATPPTDIAQDSITHLKWLIDAHIRTTVDMPPWFSFSFMEAKNFPAKERRMVIDIEKLTERRFSKVCDRAKANGVSRDDLREILWALIKPLLQDWYVKRTKYHRRKITVETLIKTVQDFILRACVNPETGLKSAMLADRDIAPTPTA